MSGMSRDDLLHGCRRRRGRLKYYDELGGPVTYSHYAAAGPVAGTPFTLDKQVAGVTAWTRNGTDRPLAASGDGQERGPEQWHNVITSPDGLEAAGCRSRRW